MRQRDPKVGAGDGPEHARVTRRQAHAGGRLSAQQRKNASCPIRTSSSGGWFQSESGNASFQ